MADITKQGDKIKKMVMKFAKAYYEWRRVSDFPEEGKEDLIDKYVSLKRKLWEEIEEATSIPF